jgi:ATP-dependent protease ClpP protease subunit
MSKKGYQITAAADGATLYVYGGIGIPDAAGYEVEPLAFVTEVAELEASHITVRIASIGGDPVAACAMHQALVDHPAPVVTIVESKAYSAASLLLQAGDTRMCKPMAMIMVHGPAVEAFGRGTADDHREAAAVIDAHLPIMEAAYVRHGLDLETVRGWLTSNKDHYFSAGEALSVGLIDAIDRTSESTASAPHAYRLAAMAANPEDPAMADETEGTVVTAAAQVPDIVSRHSATVKRAQADGIKLEAKRRGDIASVFAEFYNADPLDPVTALHDQCMENTACDELGARRQLLAYLAGRTADPILAREHYTTQAAYQPPAPPRASRHLGGAMLPGPDQSDKRAQGLMAALSIKAGVVTDRKVIDQERRGEFLSMSLIDLMAFELRASGYDVHGSREDIARRYVQALPILAGGPSHGTDHLPAVLGNIANLSAMQGWESAPESWPIWTQSGTLNNYQTATRANLGLLDKLTKMLENQEWEYGDLAEIKQRITGYFYGLKYSLSIQAIVNDDLGELARTMQGWGEVANATVGDAVHAVLFAVGGGGFGQLMDEDSKPLFHADHGNYVADGAGAAPNETTLNAARGAMVAKTDGNGRKISSVPKFLIHGASLFSTAHKVLNSQEIQSVTVDGATGATVLTGSVNSAQTMNLVPVEDYRIGASSPDAAAWVLAAARRTVEVAGVGGPVTPRAEQSVLSNVPGITYELSMPFGVAALDHRGLYLNMGK